MIILVNKDDHFSSNIFIVYLKIVMSDTMIQHVVKEWYNQNIIYYIPLLFLIKDEM